MTAVSETTLQLPNVRRFAADRIRSRLAADANLVARFWVQITAPDSPAQPDMTVLYCSIGWRGETYYLMEFVAGETLQGLVTRSDPAACEQEVPLFCEILDAFEGSKGRATASADTSGLELLDFGVVRANSSVIARLHGAVLSGTDGTWMEAVVGPRSSQVRSLLVELSAKLPGGTQQSAVSGAAALGECTIISLSSTPPPEEVIAAPIPAAAAPKASLLATLPVSPYIIAVATATLVLVMLCGVGGFLAKRSMPANAGQLNLPPVTEPVAEAPAETAPAQPDALTIAANAAPVRPKQPKASNTRIVLTRGAKPIVQTKLQYPPDAQKERISGVVEMQLTIAEDGSVHSPRVLSGDPVLGAGLAEQISKWVYQPLRVNGKPVPMTTELAVRFDLNP